MNEKHDDKKDKHGKKNDKKPEQITQNMTKKDGNNKKHVNQKV